MERTLYAKIERYLKKREYPKEVETKQQQKKWKTSVNHFKKSKEKSYEQRSGKALSKSFNKEKLNQYCTFITTTPSQDILASKRPFKRSNEHIFGLKYIKK